MNEGRAHRYRIYYAQRTAV